MEPGLIAQTEATVLLCLLTFYIPVAVVYGSCPKGFYEDSVGTACYKTFPEPKQWTEARKECQKYQSDLIKIETITSYKAVEESVGQSRDSISSYWIGLNDIVEDGDYRWVDGSLLARQKLVDFELLLTDSKKDACFMAAYGQTRWEERSCEEEYAYICEYIPEATSMIGTLLETSSVASKHQQMLARYHAISLLDCARFCIQEVGCDVYAFDNKESSKNCILTFLGSEPTDLFSGAHIRAYIRTIHADVNRLL